MNDPKAGRGIESYLNLIANGKKLQLLSLWITIFPSKAMFTQYFCVIL